MPPRNYYAPTGVQNGDANAVNAIGFGAGLFKPNQSSTLYNPVYNTPAQQSTQQQDSGSTNLYSQQQSAAQRAQQAALNQQLAQLDFANQRADAQLGVARTNVNNGYQSAYDQLVGQKAQQQKQFDQTKLEQNQGYQSGQQDINQSVSNAYTGLQRLLGSRGAGNSSAASILAPYAAGQQGNIQRQGLQQNYAGNQASLENAIGAYNTNWDNSVGDLNKQKETNLRAAEAAYNNAKAQILQSRQALNPGNASAYQQQINQLLGQVDQLGINPTFTPKVAEYKAPDLASYQTQQIAPAQIGGVSPGAVQNTGAFANLLAGQDKKKLVGQSPVGV